MPRGRPKGSKNKPKAPITTVGLGIIKGETGGVISPIMRQSMINTAKVKNTPPEQEEKTPPPEKKKGKPAKSDEEKYPRCQRCGKIIYCQPFRCDTNLLTGRADYHREAPRYIELCSDCTMELSRLVDEWLLNNGNGVKPKLGS